MPRLRLWERKRWHHRKDIVSVCPDCGKPVHLGMFLDGSPFFMWLHDDYPPSVTCGVYRLSKQEAYSLVFPNECPN